MLGQLLDAQRHVLNTDQWDGYPHSRTALLEQLKNEAINNTVIVTGDIHSAWAMDITPDPFKGYDPSSGEGSLAVELVTTSVTSPGAFGTGEDAIAAEKRTIKNLPHLHWTDFRHRGYLTLDLNAERANAEWWAVDTITERSDRETRAYAMLTQSGRNHLEAS
jgi:alkaline phosphatase D